MPVRYEKGDSILPATRQHGLEFAVFSPALIGEFPDGSCQCCCYLSLITALRLLWMEEIMFECLE